MLARKSASYNRVAHALTIALTSIALGKEVHVLFTYGALIRLVRRDRPGGRGN